MPNFRSCAARALTAFQNRTVRRYARSRLECDLQNGVCIVMPRAEKVRRPAGHVVSLPPPLASATCTAYCVVGLNAAGRGETWKGGWHWPRPSFNMPAEDSRWFGMLGWTCQSLPVCVLFAV